MAIVRLARVGVCALLLAAALLAPGVTSADSNGAPNISGTWTGKLKSKYWDQTSSASTKPKLKYKSDVTVTIVQMDDDPDLAVILVFDDDAFPAADDDDLELMALSGFVGNGHLNLSTGGAVTFALSGEVNKNADKIKLDGIAASSDFTHELEIKLKRRDK